ncbi:MAG: HAD family hydrolase [Firmicutes bacterium]|nr:HAD family hydrolase [Bacillota bacterium]
MALCFDLDGTLGHFEGGYALLRAALGELWGEEPTVEELSVCKGSTDWEIVDELHRNRFGEGLEAAHYHRYDQACLAQFTAAFGVGLRQPVRHDGLAEGLVTLLERGHRLWLVSGNTPGVLAFKAQALVLDSRLEQVPSLPHRNRADLLRLAMEADPGPHLYVGDRRHDREAAQEVGMPFLAVGDAVPGSPKLSPDAPAERLVEAVAEHLR